jgi:hypothetical protein
MPSAFWEYTTRWSNEVPGLACISRHGGSRRVSTGGPWRMYVVERCSGWHPMLFLQGCWEKEAALSEDGATGHQSDLQLARSVET